VLAQISYPLLSGAALRVATIATVLLLAGAAVTHAAAVWTARAGLMLLGVAGGLGLAVETIGVHTGYPYGDYTYSTGLGTRLAGVPLVVPLAWTMMAYPCLLLGRRLTGLTSSDRAGRRPGGSLRTLRPRGAIALVGGFALTSWDLFLDPQMVAQGHWSWTHPDPALPGVPAVPLTNYAGWLIVSVVMIAALDRVLPAGPPRAEAVPAAILAWTWIGSAVGNLVFFDRPWVALYGGLAMGATALPYLVGLIRSRR
jgi:putative membrane protein